MKEIMEMKERLSIVVAVNEWMNELFGERCHTRIVCVLLWKPNNKNNNYTKQSPENQCQSCELLKSTQTQVMNENENDIYCPILAAISTREWESLWLATSWSTLACKRDARGLMSSRLCRILTTDHRRWWAKWWQYATSFSFLILFVRVNVIVWPDRGNAIASLLYIFTENETFCSYEHKFLWYSFICLCYVCAFKNSVLLSTATNLLLFSFQKQWRERERNMRFNVFAFCSI